MPCSFSEAMTARAMASVGRNQLKKVQLSPSGSGMRRKEISGTCDSISFKAEWLRF